MTAADYKLSNIASRYLDLYQSLMTGDRAHHSAASQNGDRNTSRTQPADNRGKIPRRLKQNDALDGYLQ